jgi:hypothetical protein
LETGDEIDDMLVKLKQQMLDTEKPSETKQRADEKRSLESDDNG